MNTSPVGSPRDLENGRSVHFEDEKQNVQTAEFKHTWFLEEDSTISDVAQKVFVKRVSGEKIGQLDANRRLVVNLSGPPSSGKATQSMKIAEFFGIGEIFARDLMGESMRNKDLFGKMIKLAINSKLIKLEDPASDEMIDGLLAKKLGRKTLPNKTSEFHDGFILVDHPLTEAQCQTYQAIFLRNTDIRVNILLNVSDDVCKSRWNNLESLVDKTMFEKEEAIDDLKELINETDSQEEYAKELKKIEEEYAEKLTQAKVDDEKNYASRLDKHKKLCQIRLDRFRSHELRFKEINHQNLKECNLEDESVDQVSSFIFEHIEEILDNELAKQKTQCTPIISSTHNEPPTTLEKEQSSSGINNFLKGAFLVTLAAGAAFWIYSRDKE